MKAVCVGDQALEFAEFVARAGARAEGRAADVDGIGTVVDGFDTNGGIACGRKQFKRVGQQ